MKTAASALRHVKPAVREAHAYTLALRQAPVKLNQNESPWDLPDELKQRIVATALQQPWNRYPDFDPRELREALAVAGGWRADGILCGNGSNELIQALLMVVVGEGAPVVIPEPTFALYELVTRVLGGRPVRVPLGDLQYDAGALVEAAQRTQAAAIVVCTPNNPTGTVLPIADVARLCTETDALVIVDEAYFEFHGETAVPLLHEHDSLVVLRTFSKAMAMPALRVGWMMAAPELVREIDKARLPYNVNVVSQAAALALLGERQLVGERACRIVGQRERVAAELAALPGVRVVPSRANFLLVEVLEVDVQRVFRAMYDRGVLVRDVSGSSPLVARCLRVSIGSPEENDALVAAFRAALEGA